jgi:hypothetical protein
MFVLDAVQTALIRARTFPSVTCEKIVNASGSYRPKWNAAREKGVVNWQNSPNTTIAT